MQSLNFIASIERDFVKKSIVATVWKNNTQQFFCSAYNCTQGISSETYIYQCFGTSCKCSPGNDICAQPLAQGSKQTLVQILPTDGVMQVKFKNSDPNQGTMYFDSSKITGYFANGLAMTCSNAECAEKGSVVDLSNNTSFVEQDPDPLQPLLDELSGILNSNHNLSRGEAIDLAQKIAFNPLFYFLNLTKVVPCEGTEGTNECFYRTPNRDPPFTNLTSSWKCEPGHYCQSQVFNFTCEPGYFCPRDSVEPMVRQQFNFQVCPPKYFCSDPTRLEKCPAGSFCPVGSTKPYECSWELCNSQAGSQIAYKYGVFLFALLVACIIWLAFKCENRRRFYSSRKHNNQVKTSRKVIETVKLSRLTHTIDIKFKDLGLVLANGVEIMKGVTGVLRSGRTTAIMVA